MSKPKAKSKTASKSAVAKKVGNAAKEATKAVKGAAKSVKKVAKTSKKKASVALESAAKSVKKVAKSSTKKAAKASSKTPSKSGIVAAMKREAAKVASVAEAVVEVVQEELAKVGLNKAPKKKKKK